MRMQLALAADTDKLALDFVEWLESYQSNHYGNFNTKGFYDAYARLPTELKKTFIYNKRGRLYRGDEFYREDLYTEYRAGKYFHALSFTPSFGLAEHFGNVAKFTQVVDTYETNVDTTNVVRWCNKQKIEHNIGDDEGEVIFIGVKLKTTLGKT